MRAMSLLIYIKFNNTFGIYQNIQIHRREKVKMEDKKKQHTFYVQVISLFVYLCSSAIMSFIILEVLMKLWGCKLQEVVSLSSSFASTTKK